MRVRRGIGKEVGIGVSTWVPCAEQLLRPMNYFILRE